MTTALPRAATLGRSAEWERLREEKAALEQIVQLAAGGIVLLDADTRVRLWNPAMERIRGLPADHALGRRYDDLLAGPDSSGARATLDSLLASRISSEGPRAVVLGLQLELTDLVEVTRRTASRLPARAHPPPAAGAGRGAAAGLRRPAAPVADPGEPALQRAQVLPPEAPIRLRLCATAAGPGWPWSTRVTALRTRSWSGSSTSSTGSRTR